MLLFPFICDFEMPWGVQSPTTVISSSVQNWKLASEHDSGASFRKKRPGAVLEHHAEAHLLLRGGDVDIMLSLSSGMEDNAPRELCRAERSLGTRTHS